MIFLPPLTIGLPIYNNERYVAQSIRSLLDQTYGDFILLIVDNASTDRTAEICREFASQDARVQYHRNELNIGLYPNFNRVFSLTRTPYLKWSTGDDFWGRDFLSEAMRRIQSDPSAVIVYPKTNFVDDTGAVTGPYEDRLNLVEDDPTERYRRYFANVRRCHPHLGVSRREAVARTNLFGNYQGGDLVFLAELALYGKFIELPDVHFFRRFHSDSSSWDRHDGSHQARRLYAANSRGKNFDYFKQYSANFWRVARSDLRFGSKFSLLKFLSRQVWWNRDVLIRDLKWAGEKYLPKKHNNSTQ